LETLRVKLEIQPRRSAIAVEIVVPLAAWPADAAPELFLPVWTPGSYLVREFARHVEGLCAVDAEHATDIPWTKTRKNRWRLAPPAGTRAARITYRVYAHELTVRTADVTEDHAFWDGAGVVLWPVGGDRLRARLEVDAPAEWRVASPLLEDWPPPAGHAALRAATLPELVDSPCLAGQLETLDFDVLGRPHQFVLEGLHGLPAPETLVPDTQRVIQAGAAVFDGELPYPRYRFLAVFSDAGRGGLEHMECSVLLAPRTTFHPRKSYEDFLGLVAHEHFHVWNVKRMRPADLWTVDLEQENYTSLLWVAEGFTAYYDDHLCLRAGILSRERYLAVLAENIGDCLRTPGRRLHPLGAASFDAWIKFYRPDEHSRNSSQSYYLSGSLAAWLLDLEILRATAGERCLDDALRWLWRETWGRGRGYAHADVVAALNAAAGRDLSALVHGLVDAPFDPDFAAALAPFGVTLRFERNGAPHLGAQLRSDSTVVGHVLADGPAARGGLAPGDEILALDGHRVTPATFAPTLEVLGKPGRPVSVLLARRARILERNVVLEAQPVGKPLLECAADATPAQRDLRERWLAQPFAPRGS
jgi:predicted metalloprotease with PDZ domain